MKAGRRPRAGWDARGRRKSEGIMENQGIASPSLFRGPPAYEARTPWRPLLALLAGALIVAASIVGAVLLLGLVALGKTWYPRWTVLANPAALLLLSPLADKVPAPVGAILIGGFTNLAIAVFFLVSVLTTWRRANNLEPA